MKLETLVRALPRHQVRGDADIDIESIELDSRRIGGGELFVCLDGLARNGHDFAATAVGQGARALVVSRLLEGVGDVPQILVPDTREAVARLAAAFYHHPARSLTAIGVTGTNGKTTVTHLLRAIAAAEGLRAEVLGTLGSMFDGNYRPTGYTTPEAPTLQRLLREAADRGAQWAALEVSSHALDQKRSFATDFAAVVFTNLTRDHLDYHGDEERYFQSKASLFDRRSRGSDRPAIAVVNLEDPYGRRLAGNASDSCVTYGFGGGVSYRAQAIRAEPTRTRYRLVTPEGRRFVSSPLLGRFNVLNALAAQATAMELGVSLEGAVAGIEAAKPVPGRMERVSGNQPFGVLVDYAHTPDALEWVLQSARGFTTGRLVVVFGCGGDRDPGKRPEMGRIAGTLADRVIVTSDNPRSEDPEAILDHVLAGIPPAASVLRLVDRREAIQQALRDARPGDTVLIAGKGHESEQIVGTERRDFDDRVVARDLLQDMGFDVEHAQPVL